MFFKHKSFERKGTKVSLSCAQIISDFKNQYLQERFSELQKLCDVGIPIKTFRILKSEDLIEEYSVEIDKEIRIYAGNLISALYALSDLKDMAVSDGLYQCSFTDKPVCGFRAYRVFLPSRSGLCDFFRVMRMLTDFKYNAIILEVGGAMEYKLHPEINKTWSEFATKMRKNSGQAVKIQYGYAWEKDSFHVDNAEGEVLSQDEIKKIVHKLQTMGLEVIPEVPTLSHSDYICLAHPELAERKEDPYPDTYCPSDERTYQIVFDILGEVLEVFQPKKVLIGHDEFYSMGLCEKCKGKDPVDLYVGDIVRIYRYLKDRGISVMMWGEKLLDARRGEEKIGGAGVDRINEAGFHVTVPPLYKCAEKIPKDIMQINWYWEFGAELDQTYIENHLPFVYGNLNGAEIDQWRKRLKGGVQGGIVSNWGGFGEETIQRNLQLYALASSSYLFWTEDYNSTDREKLHEKVAKTLYDRYLSLIPSRYRIEVLHTVTQQKPHKFFYDGEFISGLDRIGDYKIEYKDGTVAKLEVSHGRNIGCILNKVGSKEWAETLYSTFPCKVEEKMFYKTVFRNPCPEKEIFRICFQADKGKENLIDYKIL